MLLGTGTGASEVMFTSSLGHRDLCHRMILLTTTRMLMHIRSVSSNCLSTNVLTMALHNPEFHSCIQWVSHRNHRGNICGVDFIWLLNPNKCRKVLKTSWSDAVFGLFKVHTIFFAHFFYVFDIYICIVMFTCV